MIAVSGVFKSRAGAEGVVEELRKTGTPADRLTLLTPGTLPEVDREVQSVPVDETEQPGMGAAIGALMGGGAGLAGGAMLVALIPGIGPISALGLLGAAILAAAGGTAGAIAGKDIERSTTEGLPHDEIYVYEDALRQGRSVVIALAESVDSAASLRKAFRSAGSETVDSAREQWWIGLRSSEQEHYSQSARDFTKDEKFYRMGFEAALNSKTRCMEFDQVSAAMGAALEDVQRQYPGADVEEPFTRGYQRGRDYYQQLCNESEKAA
jgi:hypothetical protein